MVGDGHGARSWMFRRQTKSLLYAIGWVVTAPFWLSERLARRWMHRDVFLAGQAQALSLLPGTVGILLRNSYFHMILAACPLHVCWQFGSFVACSDVHIGKNVYFGARSSLGLVDIGDETIISDGVRLLSGGQQHSSFGLTHSLQTSPTRRQRIHVGRNCWIGAQATIMADVGENCIIGAGAVVTRPIPANSVAVGVPAKVIRQRLPQDTPDADSSELLPGSVAAQI